MLWLASPARAQDRELQQLAREAGIVFTGTVDRIEAVPPAAPSDIGVVRVTFRVGDALRGATPGASLTISEWAGLWTSGDRYRVGENLLLFLYAPSGGLGLTTTVEGARGRISLGDSPISLATLALEISADSLPPPVPQHTRPIPARKPSRLTHRALNLE